jgi:hypothetical protein
MPSAGAADAGRVRQNGEVDTMAPGALLATIMDAVAGPDGSGLAGCSDDQLMGIISAARRMESRTAWTLLAAVAEFAARHDGSRPLDEFAPDELAFELHQSRLSAAGQMTYASSVTTQLPRTFAALAPGRIHPVHLRIIAEETSILSDADAAKADVALAEAAPGLTFGEVRSAAHKLVLKLDPEAVRKRKEAAKRETHVRQFREDSGTQAWSPASSPPTRCSPRGSTWSSGPGPARDRDAWHPTGTARKGLPRPVAGTRQPRPARRPLGHRWRPPRQRAAW